MHPAIAALPSGYTRMGISETVLAAGIGGAATITAALFQLYTALRVKTKPDTRPKKTSIIRSYIAIAALMFASAVSGYLFAEFRQQQVIEDARAMHEELRGMRDEINAQLEALKQTAEHLARERGDEPNTEAEELLLARGPTDRACEDGSGDAKPACEAAPTAAHAPEEPAAQPATEHGTL